MLKSPVPISTEEIGAALADERRQTTIRRVLPKSVIVSLHKQAFEQALNLSATHKAIQTYTTTPAVPNKQLEFLKVLFSAKTLSAEEIASMAKHTGLSENKTKELSTMLPSNLKKQMESTMETLLTFGHATSRELPRLSLIHAQKMVSEDIKYREKKIEDETRELLDAVSDGKILQVGVMLDVITSGDYPFCLLNKVEYSFYEFDYVKFIECYVLLYAKKVFDDQKKLLSIAVWTQLFPVNIKDFDRMFEKPVTSEVKYISYPDGFALFQFADTAIQVELSSLQEDSFLLDAKPKGQLIQEMKQFVRTMTAPGKKKAGIALHVTFAYQPDKSLEIKKEIWA
ncbi:hypothetical protein [Candidatus Parabeggiatoa sp. HSG14]|uniref:hypothetical protein n=1 Tax=Candidatus Parabeggiatoa sp. HSG14 TaxID=3055593 RepID=UPI0025A69A94|nr:hypothetical protein [Thiotrichales bacterium HSG14]